VLEFVGRGGGPLFEQGLLDGLVPAVVKRGVEDSSDGGGVGIDAQIPESLVRLCGGRLEEVVVPLRNVMADDLSEDSLERAKFKG
jgi:hypothetical protein